MFGTTVGPDCCPGRREKSRPASRTRSGRSGERSPAGVRGSPRIRATPIGPANSEEASPLRLSIRRDFGRSDLDSSRSASPARYWSFRANVVSREIFSAPASSIRHAGLRGGFSTSPLPRRDSGRRDRWSVEIASSRPMEVIPSDRVPRQPSRMRWERWRGPEGMLPARVPSGGRSESRPLLESGQHQSGPPNSEAAHRDGTPSQRSAVRRPRSHSR